MRSYVAALTVLSAAACAAPAVKTTSASPAEMDEFTLTSLVFANERTVCVYLPPGYRDGRKAYPLVVMLDGGPAFFGEAWNGPGAADAFWAADGARFVLVGVDNGGATSTTQNPVVDRASEFLPAPDPSWTEPPRPDPRGARHPQFLFDEVLPQVAARYRVDQGPITLVGASYGAIAALHAALERPDRVGALVLESPSLQVDGETYMRRAAGQGADFARVYIGVGGAEGETPGAAADFVAKSAALFEAFDRSGTDACFAYADGAEHWYTFWAARLPDALAFAVAGERQGLCAAASED